MLAGARRIVAVFGFVLATSMAICFCVASDPVRFPTIEPPAARPVVERLPALEKNAEAVTAGELAEIYRRLERLEVCRKDSDDGDDCTAPDDERGSKFYVDYDRGFVIRAYDPEANPFEMKINARIQFRYVNFARDITSYTNSAGVTRPINNRSDFDIERARLVFSGFAYDPDLTYFLQLDGDTDDFHMIELFDFWIEPRFSDAFRLRVGKSKVPGSRDWLITAFDTRSVDRSMANSFFRPDRTIGIWALGELADNVHYQLMLGNGFAAPNLRFDQIDDRFAYSGTLYWDPWGDFGQGYSDLDWHVEPVVRIGHSLTYADQDERITGNPLDDQFYARLSDGTPLVERGALAPGVTVSSFNTYLYAVDLAMKYRGFGFNAEYYLRWIQELRADGPLPLTKLFDHGFYFDAGYMFVPQRWEVFGRISTVQGLFGDGWEYAGGINFFVNGTEDNKVSMDVTRLRRNPADNPGTDLVVGADGVLVRAQWQLTF